MSDAPVNTPRSMIERKLGPDDVGAQGFLKWLKSSMPAVYQGISADIKRLQAQAASASLSGMGSFGEAGTSFEVPASSAPASSSWADSISKLVAAWGQYKLTDQQLDTVKKITDANLARAQQGLAPLPYDAAQLGLAPTVNVGLSNDAMSFLKWGGLAAGAFLLLKTLTGRRSRT